jgi:D-sedoheptulose 7-phosphate isomerase
MFIGNGGSAAIASHMALDFANAGKLRTISFNDGPFLTCLANDHSFERAFEKAVQMHADTNDVLVAISSSGESENIHNAVRAARAKGCAIITLSGFEPQNTLVTLGDVNIHVPISRPQYRLVEACHHILLSYLLELVCSKQLQ